MKKWKINVIKSLFTNCTRKQNILYTEILSRIINMNREKFALNNSCSLKKIINNNEKFCEKCN